MLQMILLEGAKATTETVDTLRTGAAAMKAMQKATYVYFRFYLTLVYRIQTVTFLKFCFYIMIMLFNEAIDHIGQSFLI